MPHTSRTRSQWLNLLATMYLLGVNGALFYFLGYGLFRALTHFQRDYRAATVFLWGFEIGAIWFAIICPPLLRRLKRDRDEREVSNV